MNIYYEKPLFWLLNHICQWKEHVNMYGRTNVFDITGK